MSAPPLTCQELVELVTDYLEEALPEAERARFEQHLEDCQGCRNYLGQMRATIRVTGALTEADLPVEAREALLEAFRRWRAGGEPPPTPG